ncbi:isocitrate lyase/phosphoenolpyruvate mutase family protein [Saccharopolyspora sp. K220]|uniref:isocitrate lyase/PEP mutase family protein n=1 Tax=Saccharopolyspora soli TaxID=2926618 RepID=UPI001F56B827|nr:isocitrate lyase/phosphoenolpyruvate mutase family protein [Saccharopolyspora soli]MCI2417448.1 isocitrate lyase/phosphoenolpyruvate mutase family protein [Saccharopolyspora soli]
MTNDKAQLLRSYHHEGPVLVLPNAWDAASAAVIEQAGARAIATTSAGVAWSLGKPDGQQVSRAEMIDAVRRVVSAVDVPVTADVESGYGDVRATVEEVIAVGAVGVNLEDGAGFGGPLREVDDQVELLRTARSADPDLVINARTDVFLYRLGDAAEVIKRGVAYAGAGADCLFVPGLLDPQVLREIVDAVPVPVSVMAAMGGPTVSELAAAGVRRISVGAGLAAAAFDFAHTMAARILDEGVFPEAGTTVGFVQLNQWLSRSA